MRLRPLIRLILTLIVNRLTERMDFQGAVQICNRHRLLFMIDEFPSLKRMDVFADALSYMAGYGLNAYLITQDIRQIVEEYGPNESIVSNCHVRIAYAPNQYDTAELLSKMTGTKTVQKATYSFSGSRLAPVANHMSATVDQIERPLMTPDEVMRLRPAKKRGRGPKERIVAPGNMLVFVRRSSMPRGPGSGRFRLHWSGRWLSCTQRLAADSSAAWAQTTAGGRPSSGLPNVLLMSVPRSETSVLRNERKISGP